MTRSEKLREIFQNIGENERVVCERLLDEVEFLEQRMTELRALPFLRVHPTDKTLQKSTAAAKQYKECMQSYMNAVRILVGILRNTEEAGEDLLAEILAEYTK